MSRYDYERSRELSGTEPFYGLLMAAMRLADSINKAKLKRMFPETWKELQDRYNAPGGILPGEVEMSVTCDYEEFLGSSREVQVTETKKPMTDVSIETYY